jgi:hypothetical protein
MAKATEGSDVLDMSWKEEILDHVKDKERLHPVVGKAFPCLGEGEIPKPTRMTEEIRCMILKDEGRGILGFSGSSHARPRLALRDSTRKTAVRVTSPRPRGWF